MANYYHYSLLDVTNPELIGTGLGDSKDTVYGVDRVCISLEGSPINEDLCAVEDPEDIEYAQSIKSANWISLTPECAKKLYEFLGQLKHIWENGEKENKQYCGGCNDDCDKCQVKADDQEKPEYDKDKECDGDCRNCEDRIDDDNCPNN